MEKATREIEKKYLKLDEPVLTNVILKNNERLLTSSEAKELSNRKK